jgi:predicted MFS family arabinose efflux permease
MLLILTVAMFASSASMRVADALLPQVAADFATTTGAASIIITAFAITYGLLQVVYGPVGDRIGKLRTIAAGTLLAGIATLGASFAGSLSMLALARLASGATAAAIIPMSLAWIGDVVPYENRQATLARVLFASISGMVLGQALGGIIGDLIGWRAVFLILGAILLLAAGALTAALRLRADAAALDRPAATHASWWQTTIRMASLLARPWVRVVVATVFCEGFVVVAAFAFIGADLHHRLAHTYAETGLGIGVLGLGGMVYAILARRLVGRLGEHGLARIGGTLVAIGLVLLTLAVDWRLAWPAIFVAGLGFYMLHNTLQTNATQMAPDARGSALGLFASSFFMGQASGVAVIGAVVDRTGTPAIFLAAAAAIVVLALWIAARLQRHHAS